MHAGDRKRERKGEEEGKKRQGHATKQARREKQAQARRKHTTHNHLPERQQAVPLVLVRAMEGPAQLRRKGGREGREGAIS